MKRFFYPLIALLLTCGVISYAQVPGVNSTLNSVFTLAYDNATNKQTFSASTQPFAAATSAEIVFAINGSATKTVKVRRVKLNGVVPATALTEPIYINKYSVANTVTGTSTLLTATPLNSNNSAATAYVENYTANPTLSGLTLVGEVATPMYTFAVGTSLQPALDYFWGEGGSAVQLNGVAEALAISFGHVSTAATVTLTVEWTEE